MSTGTRTVMGDVDRSWVTRASIAQLQSVIRRRSRPGARLRVGSPTLRPALRVGDEAAIAIRSAHAGAGASTLALCLADVADAHGSVRLVEWCHPRRTGLAAAAARELGEVTPGWLRGVRGGHTWVDRPCGPTHPLAVADTVVSRDLLVVAVSDPLVEVDAPHVVLVARLTIPGLAQAEAALQQMPSETVLAVVGPRHWPTALARSVGPRITRLSLQDRIVSVPINRRVAWQGPTSDPMPVSLQRAAARLACLACPTSALTTTALIESTQGASA